VKIFRVMMSAAGFVAVSLMVSGCHVGPTYGTGKSAGQQLVDDITSLASLRTQRTVVETRPRPDLVPPSEEVRGQLLPPQEHVVEMRSQDWPESPEERRKRLRDEATANQDNPRYQSPIESDMAIEKPQRKRGKIPVEEEAMPVMTRGQMRAQAAEYQRKQKENKGGSATARRYLSEPPIAYRQPASSAPVDEMGDDEAHKERKRNAASKSKSGKSKWWPF